MAGNDDLIQPIQQVVVRFTPLKQGSGTELDDLGLVRDRIGPDDFGPIGIGIDGELFGIQEIFDSHPGSVFIGAWALHGAHEADDVDHLGREGGDAHVIPIQNDGVPPLDAKAAFLMPLRRQCPNRSTSIMMRP